MASRKPWSGNGTTGGAAVTVDVRSPGQNRELAGAVAIKNNALVGSVSVSWDGGTTYTTTIGAGQGFSTGPCTLAAFMIHAGGAAIAFEWVAVDKEED